MKFSRAVPVVIFFWALTFLRGDARAGGYASARFGGEHGHVASDHVTTLYYNPAGLALGTGTRIYAEGLLAHRLATYDRPVEAVDNVGTGTPDDPRAIAANTGKAELNNFIVSPFLGVVSDLGVPNLGVGLGVYVPFGGQASWGTRAEFADDGDYPGAFDGPQRWSTIEGTQRALFATLGGAYHLAGPRISIGVGLNLVRQSVSVVRARNANGTDDLVSPVGVSEGRTLLEGAETSVSVGAGVLWQAMDQLRVGLSYQSQPNFGGTSRLDGTLTSQFPGAPVGTTETTLEQALPDIVRLGVTYQASPRLELRLSGDYTRWSVFDRHCLLSRDSANSRCVIAEDGSTDAANGGAGVILVIPRDWQDTFGVRAGASYWASPVLEAFGGLSYDSNAIPSETLDAGLMDMDKLVASVGVGYTMMRGALRLTGSLTNITYFGRDIAPTDDRLQVPSRNPDNAGAYEQSIRLLTVGLEYALR